MYIVFKILFVILAKCESRYTHQSSVWWCVTYTKPLANISTGPKSLGNRRNFNNCLLVLMFHNTCISNLIIFFFFFSFESLKNNNFVHISLKQYRVLRLWNLNVNAFSLKGCKFSWIISRQFHYLFTRQSFTRLVEGEDECQGMFNL